MIYVLALVAIAMPVILVVQTVRGRVRPQCCASAPEHDLRITPVAAPTNPSP